MSILRIIARAIQHGWDTIMAWLGIGVGVTDIPVYRRGGSGTTTLVTMSLSGTLTNGVSSSGTILGATPTSTIVSNVSGLTVNSGARTYSWDGTGAVATTSNGLVETLVGATGSPKSTSITVVAAVTLATLSLSGTITNGTSSSGTITGASTGSTIVSNVTGLTVNSGARTYSWDGTGAAGSTSNGLVETLSGAIGSPKNSSITVAAEGVLTAPTLTKTSAAGAQLAFTVTFDASYVGKYFHLQLAGANNFTTPLAGEGAIREVTQPITSDDVISGPVFSILATQPAGAIYARLYIEDDSPTTSAASNVINDTVAASFGAVFSSTNRTTFGGQSGTISNGGLTYAGYDFGSRITFRCATATGLTNAIGIVEFTMPATMDSDDAFGLTNAAYDYTGAATLLGGTNSFGVRKNVGGVAGVYSSAGLIGTPPTLVDGATYQLVVHKASGKAWIRYPGGTWYPDTPTFDGAGAVTGGTGYATSLTDFLFAVCANRGGAFIENAGQGAFSQTPPTNAPLGWV